MQEPTSSIKSLSQYCTSAMTNSKSSRLKLPTLLFTITLGIVVAAETDDNGAVKNYDGYDVAGKTPPELIRLRGFEVDGYNVTTPDGWKLQVSNVKNPLIARNDLKRPILFVHGFLESATFFLINSLGIKPLPLKDRCPESLDSLRYFFNESQYVNGPMMLANRGFDVWVMALRGTEFSSNEFLDPIESKFWDYTLDDFSLIDVPTVIDFIRERTGTEKVGYVGHSQGTFTALELLSKRTAYADKVEPVVLIAPIAFLNYVQPQLKPLLISRLLSEFPIDGPVPPHASVIRKTFFKICIDGIPKLICTFIENLAYGKGRKLPRGYFSHIPFTLSIKSTQQYQQIFQAKRPQMYDYGIVGNLLRYGTKTPPSLELDQIKSKSLCLISSKADSLSTPKNVEELRQTLGNASIPIYRDVFINRDNINHLDLVLDREASMLVFGQVLKIFEEFERKTGSCAGQGSEKPKEGITEITGDE